MKKQALVMIVLVFFIAGCSGKKEDTKKSMVETTQTTVTKGKMSESSSTTEKEKSQSTTNEKVASEESNITKESSVAVSKRRDYTEAEKQAISNEFLKWAGERATLGGMAVNDHYFDHGASGRGDWYAVTTEGQFILVQKQDPTIEVGDRYFANALGGVVFYTSKHGATGLSNELNDQQNHPSTAAGFSEVADPSKPIVKYLLGDNGVVYEFQSSASFTSGFYVTDDEGSTDYWPSEQVPFFVSKDLDAQNELQRILANYN